MAADSQYQFVEELCSLLQVSPKDEIIQYALTFQNKRDVEEYLESILGDGHGSAIKRCLSAWKLPNQNPSSILSTNKLEEDGEDARIFKGSTKNKGLNGDAARSKETRDNDKSSGAIPRTMAVTDFALSAPPKQEFFPTTNGHQKSPQSARKQPQKKSHKFVSLYTSEGKSKASEIMMLPGCRGCNCSAQKHKLVSNCLECGRIVCEQEGSGPCLFCGNLVCTTEEQEILSRNSKTSEKLYKKLMKKNEQAADSEKSQGLEQAKALKDKLVGFDRTSARRTKVIDDQADYFSSESKWLTGKQREDAQIKEQKVMDKKHNSRRSRKYVLDFLGREVREEVGSHDYFSEENFEQEAEHAGTEVNASQTLMNPSLKIKPPVFVETAQFDKDFPKAERSSNASVNKKNAFRLQDEEMQKVSDKGMCLSMHQPWASLLVMGIKKVEGRSWFSPHRGRLWIASTVKAPEPELVKSIEDFYRFIYKDDVVFPDSYPTGALLGCVDVVDCLAQDEYQLQEQGIAEENESEFVFMCENPQELFMKLPVKGKHKIWKLDQLTHKSAKSGLIY
eukprot:gene5925-6611_t